MITFTFIADETDIAPREPINLMALENDSCRYPVHDVTDDAPPLFCGARTRSDSSSYCDHHHRLCYVPYVRKLMPRIATGTREPRSKYLLEEV